MNELPTGTVTFLFTDIEDSTRMWETYPEKMPDVISRHDSCLRSAIESQGGYVFKTVGDSFCAAFAEPSHAVQAAAAGQLALHAEFGSDPNSDDEGEPLKLRVRMAMMTGAATERDGDYFGRPLNRAARLLAIAHGEQIILSSSTRDALSSALPGPLSLLDLGFHRLKDLLEPESVMQVLHPGLRRTFPPLRSLQFFRHNLPSQLTSFIGREKELADILDLLTRVRMVTLIGSGGTGKTRLAEQTAAEMIDRFEDGVWLVELASLTDPALVAQTLAASLEVREQPGRQVIDVLCDYLRQKSILIVLDNCEHVVETSARLSESILRACPNVRILTTSREPLQTAGEHTYRVPTMGVPELKRNMSLVEVERFEAVRLFQERAEATASFDITDENVEAVLQICRRLDGIPLAIELAAARVRALSVHQIAQRLDDRFSLLTRGGRTKLPRQQTLRALIEWSWDLLSPEERVLLRRLSVFAGGFTLDAVEAVCSDAESNNGGISDVDILDLLTNLVDKSLVVNEEKAGGPRFRLMETIRRFADEELAKSGEMDDVRRRHFRWSMALAQEAEAHFDGPQMQKWLDRIELEHDNLRAALTVGSFPGERLRLAIAIHRFWFVRGYLTEGRTWLESILPTCESADAALRAKALNNLGVLAWHQGDYAGARPFLEQCLEIRKNEEDREGAAAALNNLGLVADDGGDPEAARAYYEEAASIYRAMGNRQRIGMVLANLGANLIDVGDFEAAEASLREFHEIAVETKDPWCTATALHNLGEVALRRDDIGAASDLSRRSLTMMWELGDQAQIAQLLMLFGNIALAGGKPELAVELWGACEAYRKHEEVILRPMELEEHETTKAAARGLLREEDFSASWARGSDWTIDEAVNRALKCAI